MIWVDKSFFGLVFGHCTSTYIAVRGGVRGIGQAGGFGCPGGMSCPIAGPGVFSSGLSLGLLFPYASHLTVVLLASVVAYAVRAVCSSILLGG